MRGKKRDSEFVSSFIHDCIVVGKDTPEAIVEHAKHRISKYDELIREAEQLRVRRAKLLDVIATFEAPAKTQKPEEIKTLSFLKIKDHRWCYFLCTKLQFQNLTIQGIFDSFSSEVSEKTKQELIFAVKQLLELKVLSKIDDLLIRGELFSDYMNFSSGGANVHSVHQST